jgi:hypothetical protein
LYALHLWHRNPGKDKGIMCEVLGHFIYFHENANLKPVETYMYCESAQGKPGMSFAVPDLLR